VSIPSPVAFAVILVLAACASTETTGSGDHGVSAVQFQDVVVPDGMALVDRFHESYSREEAGWRLGHFEYVGQPRVEDACSHLLLRMPQHHWRLASDETSEDKTRKLRFERGRYVAKYTLQRIDGVTHMVIDYSTEIPSR
jgi:hypothetical protein